MNPTALRPVRVLVTKEGCALPPRMAESRYGVTPDIVFYRKDGWSLGSPADLEEHAFKLWEWIAFQKRGEDIKPIKLYQRKEPKQ